MWKRIGSALLTLLGIATLVFVLLNVVPGDPARLTLGQTTNAQTLKDTRASLGLDKPLLMRYALFINDLSPVAFVNSGSATLPDRTYLPIFRIENVQTILQAPYLKRSYQSRKLVSETLWQAFGNTAVLALAAMAFAFLVGVAIGVVAALKPRKWYAQLLMSFAALGISVPSYLAAVLAAYVLGYVLHDYTGLPVTGNLIDYDLNGSHLALQNLVLPALTLGVRPLSMIAQLTQSSMLDVLSQDFIRTGRAKGLSEKQLVLRHALPNAIMPVITAASGWLASLLAGAVFVEYIFGWFGLGKVTVDALLNFDLPLVVGSVLWVATLFITINLLIDVLYTRLDPRVRL